MSIKSAQGQYTSTGVLMHANADSIDVVVDGATRQRSVILFYSMSTLTN